MPSAALENNIGRGRESFAGVRRPRPSEREGELGRESSGTSQVSSSIFSNRQMSEEGRREWEILGILPWSSHLGEETERNENAQNGMWSDMRGWAMEWEGWAIG
ncbi:hypothetical protein FH972_002206 [Carpinus fangiana]|uniref:Uncharacterized protein n=1 Tax=Carpinus fangiana TaxID=176857 RepID=A0A5N6QEP1_9ROSI|nr:hypothetical protein FH972_002206 [Carpinus fangiana]